VVQRFMRTNCAIMDLLVSNIALSGA
jgi:hypothetical protein